MTFTEFKKTPAKFYFEIQFFNSDGKITTTLTCHCWAFLCLWRRLKSALFWILHNFKKYLKNSRILLNFKRPGIEFSIYGHNEFDTAVTSLGDEKYLHVLVLEDRRQTYRITMSTCHAARLAALARSWRRHNKKPTTTAINQYSQTAAIDSKCVAHIFALTRDSVTLTFNPWRDMVMTHTQVKIKIEGLVQQIK